MEDEELKSLLKKCSLKEKCSLLYGNGDWHTNPIERIKLRSLEMHDGPLGLRKPTATKVKRGDFVASSTKATCFPAPALYACSWDPKLVETMGHFVAEECLSQNTDMVLAPGVNIKRHPLCGRNFEYLSEDPLLAGKMGAAYINGVQSYGVGTCLKHYACNNQEDRRFVSDSVVDERALHELYLKPFEIAVAEGNPWSVMCSYNRVNGTYSCDNDFLLVDTLKNKWGFAGAVISDWGATFNPTLSHNHGLDLEMPCHMKRAKYLAKAVKKGRLNAEKVDDSAFRVAKMVEKAMNREKNDLAWNFGMSHAAAENVVENSIVLASNSGILPLKDYSSSLIVGPFSKHPRYQGAGSSQINANNVVDFLSEAEKSERAKLSYAEGYSIGDAKKNQELLSEAVEKAKNFANVIMFLGLPDNFESEGYDRDNMRLPLEEYALFNAVHAANPNIIVVLMCGSPVELDDIRDAKAILIAYLTGEAGGEAIDKIILGKVNPSGKLAETWPLFMADVPSTSFYPGEGKISLYKESLFVGYRYYESYGKNVLFPFGHGLSYSTFAYSKLSIEASKTKKSKNFTVSFSIKNTSKIDGKEVAEIYIGKPGSLSFRPKRELKAFTKVFIKAGQSKAIAITIPYSSLSLYSKSSSSFEVENGQYSIEVGASCGDIRLSGVYSLESKFLGDNQKESLVSYYPENKKDLSEISDSEFAILYGKELPKEEKPGRPYTLNSTIRDMQNTLIGKIMVNVATTIMTPKGAKKDPSSKNVQMALDSPLRFFFVAGMKDGVALGIRDLANRKPLKALHDFLFGKIK